MPASDLEDAALQAYARLSLRWTANTIQASFQAYIVACSSVVNDSTAAVRTVGNWIVPMTALSTELTAEAGNPASQALFNKCVDYVYRFNQAGFYANVLGNITPAQATALLAAYNANIF